MKWSWRAGRIAGIDVYFHVTFLIFLAWIGLSYYLQRRAVRDALAGLLFVGTLFAIIVLHELGHALTARRFGIRTRDITLLPIGGVARLERMPDEPWQELLVAIAGPAVNVVLAVVFFFGFLATWHAGSLLADGFDLVGGPFLSRLVWVNVLLAAFNMLPAFPMDGGRVLRALLAMRIDYVRATEIASNIGQAMAVVFGFLGLFTNPFLLFIALFVWMGAAAEASVVQLRTALGGIPVSRAMITEFRTLAPADPIERAVEHILGGFQQDFPVLEGGRLVGVLTREGLLRAMAEGGRGVRVGEAMHTDFLTAEPAEMLERALERLQRCACRSMPVLFGDRLVGLLTADNVAEYLMIEQARLGRRPSGWAG